MPRFMKIASSVLWFVMILPSFSLAQKSAPATPAACAMPSFSNVVNEPNIFNEQQEEWLGEILEQQVRREFNFVQDPENDYLQRLGERLVAQLPPGKTRYRFAIIDSPGIDAFGAAGGYIYISRRLISLARTEDELAGILGHEIGHIVTHQSAIDVTRDFREVLGVTQVGDRKDIFDRWNQFINAARKADYKFDQKREQQEQLIADRIGLYVMTRGGYQPSSSADIFDRVVTKGRKASFWSDFFHTTSPDAKRLGELVHNAVPLPPECVSHLSADANIHFLKWQKGVIESKFASASEVVPGLVSRVELKPKLRNDLNSIEFSPDGKYLLAQDESSIFLLSREPLANLFRIDAPDTNPAHFTPDSQAIVFYDKELRVQKWDLTTRQRTWIYELGLTTDCLESSLSPSGEVLACVSPEFELQLIEVSSNKRFYSRSGFFQVTWQEGLQLYLNTLKGVPFHFLTQRYSPDGRYFLIGHANTAIGYDLKSRTEIKLPSKIKEIMAFAFTFISPDEVAGYDPVGFYKSIVRLSFPSGKKLDEIETDLKGELSAPVKGNYVLLLHLAGVSVAALDLATKKVALTCRAPGFAIYDPISASETVAGEIALLNNADSKLLSKIQLPDGPLQIAEASDFSADGKWLAVSGPTRGGLWKLETGIRSLQTWGFQGALFDQNQLIAQFSKTDITSARVAKLNTATMATEDLYYLGDPELEKSRTQQTGDVLITITPDDPKIAERKIREKLQRSILLHSTVETNYIPIYFSFNFLAFTLSIRDVRTNKALWEYRVERELPKLFYSKAGKTLTAVTTDYETIKADAKTDSALHSKLEAIKGKQGDFYEVRAFDALTGKNLGGVLVDTGKRAFKIRTASTVGEVVLVRDSLHRTLVYSLKSGEVRGTVMGDLRGVSNSGDRMLVDNGKGEAGLYDIASLKEITHFNFPSGIVHAEFANDGSTILVLTGDQIVYRVKNAEAQESAKAN